ncbi:MAG: hypothetical protein ACYC8T_07260 [Myxococcaceae bacterium]
MLNLLDADSAPPWFHYPKDYLRTVQQTLIDLSPWYLMDRDQVLERMKGLRERYSNRQLVPFARRDDNDDLACWEQDRGERVLLITDFSASGQEQRRVLPDFWAWFRAAVDDMIHFKP